MYFQIIPDDIFEMISVSIPSTCLKDGAVFYILLVQNSISRTEWQCLRRYNEFDALHDQLVKEHSVAKNKLPKKKVIGNKSAQFIEQRQVQLEAYLQYVLHFLAVQMPEALVKFLDLHRYDKDFLLQSFAKHLFENGEKIMLKDGKQFNFYALQVKVLL